MYSAGFDYGVTDHGAAWAANVTRDDFRQMDIESVSVTNSIWVHNGKLANLTSTLSDSRAAAGLGGMWRPGSSPARAFINL